MCLKGTIYLLWAPTTSCASNLYLEIHNILKFHCAVRMRTQPSRASSLRTDSSLHCYRDVLYQVSSERRSQRRNKGGHLPPSTALWGRQIEVGMLWTNYEMSNIRGCYYSPVATGGFDGLISPNKDPSTPNWNMKHYKLVEFLSKLNVKPPLHERKAPPHKGKAPLLTTFWRRFCVNNYYLQYVECHYEISSRSPRFAKRAIMNLSDVSRWSFCLQQ